MKAIHQFVAGFCPGDAISNESILFRDIFRDWGYNSEIFCEECFTDKCSRHHIFDIHKFPTDFSNDDTVLLHLSMGSKVNNLFSKLSCKKAILYHNITPSNYFNFINKQTARNLKNGREQVADLFETADLNMADSRFNAAELESFGYKDVEILPLVLDFSMLTDDIDNQFAKKLQDKKKNILFVGRCTPNKKIEDLLQVFAYYQKTIEPDSRLIHVGSHAGSDRYYTLLTVMVKELGIKNVMFTGSVSQPELNACYANADAFLCMSEHEGFCIPLIESMLHEIPILAHASAAIPETMDGSGILMAERNFDVAAELLNQLVSNTKLRNAVIKQQSERLARYRNRDLQAELKQHLSKLI